MARSALVLLVAALAAPAALAAGRVGALGKGEVFSWGHAPYTYGPLHCTAHTCDVVPSCNRALWAKNISEYNQNAPEGSQMNIVYSYGGDIEFWAGKEHPDGCEQGKACMYNLGKNESDMAQLLLAHGAWHAINLDGGGSSSVVVDGKVVNHPTDTDAWALKKERAVTTIVCVQ